MEKKFSVLRTFLIGMGFLGINLVWPVFNSFVPLFLQAGNPEFERQLLEAGREIPKVVGFGLAPSLAFFIMTWDNIFNVVVSPWSGMQSDRTWNRFGRRKPWILLGVPVAAVGLLLIPVANTLFGIMVFIVITNFGMALFRSPTVAWLGDLFTAENRSQANGIINLMGGVGGAIALFGSGMLFDQFGRLAPFIGTVVILVLSEGIAVLSVKEPEKVHTQAEHDPEVSFLRNFRKVLKGQSRSANLILLSIFLYFMAYEALQTGLTSFAVFNLGMTPGSAAIITALFAGAFILFAIPSGFISGRLGRKRMIMIGLTGMILLFFSGYFLIQTPFSLGFVLVFTGVSWAFINVNSLPLVFDYGEEGKSGIYTGLYYVAAQAAAVSGPVLSGIVVDALGNNYRYLWAVSAVYVLLALLAMRAVKPREA